MNPGPRTLSTSPIWLVKVCVFCSAKASFRLVVVAGLMEIDLDLPILVTLVLSVRVFQPLQAGHWPDHLVYSLPQEEQKKIVLDLAMS